MDKATREALEITCNSYLNFKDYDDSEVSKVNSEIIKFVVDNSYRNENGRLVVPALWNEDNLHRLPNNFGLAHKVLNSVFKKLKRDPAKLKEYDNVIKQQIEDGIMEIVPNIEALKADQNASFLPHNGVFRPHNDTTKCRIVNLSNLCDRSSKDNLSHNQVSLPGPQLNSKLILSLTLYRFNRYLLIYDLKRAFHQLCLREQDTYKFLLLWFKDLSLNDLEVVCYKQLRVPFGARFSPTLLMISLYIILILNSSEAPEDEMDIRRMLYNMAYMDNISFSASSSDKVLKAFNISNSLFASYGFDLQKFACNDDNIKKLINDISNDGVNDSDDNDISLLGHIWNSKEDYFRTRKCSLDSDSRTKRTILKTLNSNYDPLGVNLPMFNRAKLFLHTLQLNGSLDWDDIITEQQRGEWRKICKQINSSANGYLERFVGDYSDEYNLLVYTDASKDFIGCTLYIQNVITEKITFLIAKNRLICKKLESKTIPVLELLGVKFGVELIQSFQKDLTDAFCPLKITNLHLYTDSTISLNWLNSKACQFDKIERKGAMINNALDEIVKHCSHFPITFHHVSGNDNPADYVTRCVSSKLLLKSIYYTGPNLKEFVETIKLTIPSSGINNICYSIDVKPNNYAPLLNLDKYSSFYFVCKVTHCVRKFLYNVVTRIRARKHDLPNTPSLANITYKESVSVVLRQAQFEGFPELAQFFTDPLCANEVQMVQQLNLFVDKSGIVRVKTKFDNLKAPFEEKFPILLPKKSSLTVCIINDLHQSLMHAGVYKILSILRKRFYLPSAFSITKGIIRPCVICKKMYGRSIQINQNDYKSYRINPADIPYRDIALDHIGPFVVYDVNNVKIKIYILIVTCLWSRAVNLLICSNIDNADFLRSLQFHIFEYGICQSILSDNGSPIVSSINQITDYLSEPDVISFLNERGIELLKFSPYPANASYLGGTVESMVKQVKNMIYSSISRNVLSCKDFEYLVKECNMIINKRPIAYKRLLCGSTVDPSVSVLTPEMLLKGYEVPSLSIIPELHSENLSSEDSPYERDLYDHYEKLRVVMRNIKNIYHDEFLETLRRQSTNKPGRYRDRVHDPIYPGDVVIIKQKFSKPYFNPVCIVDKVEVNDIDEVVAVEARKGNGKVIRRHITDVVLLERGNIVAHEGRVGDQIARGNIVAPGGRVEKTSSTVKRPKSKRLAAQVCANQNKYLAAQNLM